MYDVIIVGAGPAGSTLAAEISQNRSVLLVDRRNLESSVDSPSNSKLCGGLISPDAQEVLGRMGVGLPRHVLAEPQLFAVRAIDRLSGIERHYQRHYINVDRFRLDQFLYSRARNRVSVAAESRLVAVEREGSRIVITARTRNSEFSASCRVLVGADGGGSFVRRTAVDGGIPAARAYVAFQESYAMTEAPSAFAVLFDPSATAFYSWAIPKNGALLVGTAARAAYGAAECHQRSVDAFREAGYDLHHTMSKRTAALVRPSRAADIATGAGQVLLVGEAAGLISPSSAEGMSYAFRSALIAADVLQESLEDAHRRYARSVRSLRRRVLSKNLKGSVIFNPVGRKIVMRSGLMSLRMR